MPPPPSALPSATKPRSAFESGALWWLVFFDAAWSAPELVTNVGSVFLMPVCFLGAAAPTYFIQKKAGDRLRLSITKAVLLGVLAALPFPVTGTAFGASLLAWSKFRSGK